MTELLPQPEVVRSFFEDAFGARVPAMSLRWEGDPRGLGERVWDLPEGVRLVGLPPSRFGVSIQRHGEDAYSMRLLWDRTCLYWPTLNRSQLLNSSLSPLLGAIGTDLWYLLDQPVDAENGVPQEAA